MLFHVLFLSLFGIISCSSNDVLYNAYKSNERNPKTYESIAQYCLDLKALSSDSTSSSIFAPLLPLIAVMDNVYYKDEYAKVMGGVDNYIRRCALKINFGNFNEEEGPIFIKMIRLIRAEEDYLLKLGLLDFEYSHKTIEFVFSALNIIDPTVKNTFDLMAGLLFYVKTDSQLKMPLSMVLKGLETPGRKIPFIAFNNELNSSETENFDNFIRECRIKQFSNFDNENEFILAKNIIYGPDSSIAAEIMFSFLNEVIISRICASEYHRLKLIRFVLRQDAYYSILNILDNCQEDDGVEKFKNELETYNRIKKSIVLFTIDDPEFHKKNLKAKRDVFAGANNSLNEFYKIDLKYVQEKATHIYTSLILLIDLTEVQILKTGFNSNLRMIMNYFSVLPRIKMSEVDGKRIEKILDLLLNPMADVRSALINSNGFEHKFVTLPYIKVSCALLTKLHLVCLKNMPQEGIEFMMTNIALNILRKREFDADRFQNFLEIHKCFEEQNLNFNIIAFLSFFLAITRNDRQLTKQLLQYSIEHQLLSKSKIDLVHLLLKNYITIDLFS